jgi:hypothetical protein
MKGRSSLQTNKKISSGKLVVVTSFSPFQCETCHFRNMYSRDPEDRNLVDVETMESIRQAILDSFWSREPTTVWANLQEAK